MDGRFNPAVLEHFDREDGSEDVAGPKWFAGIEFKSVAPVCHISGVAMMLLNLSGSGAHIFVNANTFALEALSPPIHRSRRGILSVSICIWKSATARSIPWREVEHSGFVLSGWNTVFGRPTRMRCLATGSDLKLAEMRGRRWFNSVANSASGWTQ